MPETEDVRTWELAEITNLFTNLQNKVRSYDKGTFPSKREIPEDIQLEVAENKATNHPFVHRIRSKPNRHWRSASKKCPRATT